MLSELHIASFKCFETLDLPLRPLTLLTGVNGGGKSSVIQALVLLSQTLAEREWGRSLLLEGPDLALGSAADVLNQKSARRRLSLGASTSAERVVWTFKAEDRRALSVELEGRHDRRRCDRAGRRRSLAAAGGTRRGLERRQRAAPPELDHRGANGTSRAAAAPGLPRPCDRRCARRAGRGPPVLARVRRGLERALPARSSPNAVPPGSRPHAGLLPRLRPAGVSDRWRKRRQPPAPLRRAVRLPASSERGIRPDAALSDPRRDPRGPEGRRDPRREPRGSPASPGAAEHRDAARARGLQRGSDRGRDALGPRAERHPPCGEVQGDPGRRRGGSLLFAGTGRG
jgi:hypothetical protein